MPDLAKADMARFNVERFVVMTMALAGAGAIAAAVWTTRGEEAIAPKDIPKPSRDEIERLDRVDTDSAADGPEHRPSMPPEDESPLVPR